MIKVNQLILIKSNHLNPRSNSHNLNNVNIANKISLVSN